MDSTAYLFIFLYSKKKELNHSELLLPVNKWGSTDNLEHCPRREFHTYRWPLNSSRVRGTDQPPTTTGKNPRSTATSTSKSKEFINDSPKGRNSNSLSRIRIRTLVLLILHTVISHRTQTFPHLNLKVQWKYRYYIYWRNSTCKWTLHAFQMCIVQESTVSLQHNALKTCTGWSLWLKKQLELQRRLQTCIFFHRGLGWGDEFANVTVLNIPQATWNLLPWNSGI